MINRITKSKRKRRKRKNEIQAVPNTKGQRTNFKQMHKLMYRTKSNV